MKTISDPMYLLCCLEYLHLSLQYLLGWRCSRLYSSFCFSTRTKNSGQCWPRFGCRSHKKKNLKSVCGQYPTTEKTLSISSNLKPKPKPKFLGLKMLGNIGAENC